MELRFTEVNLLLDFRSLPVGTSCPVPSVYTLDFSCPSCFSPVTSCFMLLPVQERAYPFVNTPLDSAPRLQEVLGGHLGVTGQSLGELVGEMVLRLTHDHILPLRITSYAQTVLQFSAQLNKHSAELQVPHLDHWGHLSEGVRVRTDQF